MDADGLSDIEREARALLDTRVEAVRSLAVAYQHAADLHAAATEGDREAAQAWSAALQSGWSPEELRKLKFSPPASPRGQRKRRARPQAAAAGADTGGGGGDEGAHQE